MPRGRWRLSSSPDNSQGSSTHLTVAPKLQGLQITAKLCKAYDRLVEETFALHDLLLHQIPVQVQVDSLFLVKGTQPGKKSELMRRIKERMPELHDYILKMRGALFVEVLLEGEITEEWLRNKRNQVLNKLTEFGWPQELLDLFLSQYQSRPRKRPAAKSTLYLQALDFKIEHPRTSWGKLAQKFCGSSAQENTLKAWAYGTKKKLAEVGVQINLENPDYATPERRKTLNVKRYLPWGVRCLQYQFNNRAPSDGPDPDRS